MAVIYRTLDYFFAMLPGMGAALVLYLCLCPWRKRRLAAMGLAGGRAREPAMLLFWLFCGGLAAVTLAPRWTVSSIADILHGYSWNAGGYPFFQIGTVNWRLFATFRFDLYILAGNLIIFVPFGFFAALLWRGYTRLRALGTGLALTGFIECWQLCVGRAFDVDDIVLNTLGVLCGYWLWLALRRLAPNFTRAFQVRPYKE